MLFAFALAAAVAVAGSPATAHGLLLLGSSSHNAALLPQDGASNSAALRMDKQIPWTHKARHWSNVILLRKQKLAFCYIPKNACARMTSLFNRMNHADSGFQSSTAQTLGINMSDVTRDNGWKFAYFTRDPLARYASAFASKCIPNSRGDIEGKGKDCGGTIWWDQKPTNDYMWAFQRRAEHDAEVGHVFDNEHWRLQTEILTSCSWDKFNPDIADFIGDISGEDVNGQVRKMLRMAGVRNLTATRMADRYFPSTHVEGHMSLSHNRLGAFYRRPSVIKAVLKLYESDYKMLRLPTPLIARLVDSSVKEEGVGTRGAADGARNPYFKSPL